jgi:hypothetical protein
MRKVKEVHHAGTRFSVCVNGRPDPVTAALAAADLDQLRVTADLAATPVEEQPVLSRITALWMRAPEPALPGGFPASQKKAGGTV